MNKKYIHWTAALVLSVSSFGAYAHGDEPHGDEPHPADAAAATAGPRFEAATEMFEMVGRLENGALTLFVNKFETNEPVLQAEVELESGEHKAVATYQAQQGSYVVSEPKFVTALSKPGAHQVIVTLTAGNEADLIEATLNMSGAPTEVADGQSKATVVALAGTLGLGVLGAGAWIARRRRSNAGAQA